jgi:tetratricopeptide (TPR) repeat protein
VLVVRARNLAANGDQSGAGDSFRTARALDPKLDINPDEEARVLVAQGWAKKGEVLTRAGRIEEALSAHVEAKQIDPLLMSDALSLNRLCWWGALYGEAGRVMSACEQAQQLEPDDVNIGDSVGLALVRAGRLRESIPLFLKFAHSTSNKTHAQRRLAWVKFLSRNQDPITPEELEWLLVN